MTDRRPLLEFNCWPYRLSVRTLPFQGKKPGSTPGKVTNTKKRLNCFSLFLVFVKTEAYFFSRKKAESGAGKFSFDGMKIIVAHAIMNAKHTKKLLFGGLLVSA